MLDEERHPRRLPPPRLNRMTFGRALLLLRIAPRSKGRSGKFQILETILPRRDPSLLRPVIDGDPG